MTWYAYASPYALKNYNDPEAQANCIEIRNWLYSFGWTDNAICGFLGNVHRESGYNPWCWQAMGGSQNMPPTYNEWRATINQRRGYGLTQFTPAQKYIESAVYYNANPDPSIVVDPVNYPAPPDTASMPGYGPYFADRGGNIEDGVAQLYFINYYADYMDYGPGAIPNFPYSQYKASLDSATYLAEVWVRNYERPGEEDIQQTLAERQDAAAFWWTFFTGLPPEPPTPPGPGPIVTKKRKIVIIAGGKWYYRC